MLLKRHCESAGGDVQGVRTRADRGGRAAERLLPASQEVLTVWEHWVWFQPPALMSAQPPVGKHSDQSCPSMAQDWDQATCWLQGGGGGGVAAHAAEQRNAEATARARTHGAAPAGIPVFA